MCKIYKNRHAPANEAVIVSQLTSSTNEVA
jgi:hypothetical protein